MKICAAQTKPVKGDIQSNIAHHQKLVNLAAAHGAEIIIFPELSLTGYEPALAKALATRPDDSRFDVFQTMADSHRITIGAGVPTHSVAGVRISTVIFQPHQARQLYSKQYIHPDEEPFFTGGASSMALSGDKNGLALAICYEISVPEHAEAAFHRGAEIYLVSVVKSVRGIDKALDRLAEIARRYALTVVMSNSIGAADGDICAGKTSVWNKEGVLVGQLDDAHEGILIFDTITQKVVKEMRQGSN